MRNFKVFEAAIKGEVYPTLELFKVEFVLILANYCDVDKLCRKPLAADVCVEFGCENGRKDDVYAVSCCNSHKVFDKLPVLFRKRSDVVVLRYAVGIEPFGMDKLLLGQGLVYYADIDAC